MAGQDTHKLAYTRKCMILTYFAAPALPELLTFAVAAMIMRQIQLMKTQERKNGMQDVVQNYIHMNHKL